MRIALTSFIVLMGLMISAAAMAGHHESAADEATEAGKEMPPVAASPADTPIAAPAPAAPETGEGEAAADDSKED